METAQHNETGVIEWGLAARALPGQAVSGDLHLVKLVEGGVLIAVVDGLGHGNAATEAARIAIETLAAQGRAPLTTLVHRCNEALRQTRGVVMTLAVIQPAENLMTWLGVGNVEGMLVHFDSPAKSKTENVLLRGGVLGYQMPTLQANALPVTRGDLLIFTTDGIRPGFGKAILKDDPPQQLADRIMAQNFKGSDDALVLVVRYLGTSGN
jgi:negative regulator of sigma-B (phosphoserine phosphatase)